MKNFFTKIAIPFALLGTASPLATAANDEGISPYIGGSYGRIDINNDDFGDDDDSTYSIYSGLKIGPIFAAQLGYVDFGGTSNDFFSTDTDGIELSGLARLLNTNAVDLYVRGGVLFWDAQLNSEAFSTDNDGEELFWGVGSDFHLTEDLSLRLEYTRYNVEYQDDEFGPIADGTDYNMNHLNAGINLSF